jgi:hypothetical protein
MSVLTELFAKFGLDTDAASFAKGALAADGVRFALAKIGDAARWVTDTIKSATFEIIDQGAELGEQAKALGISTSALQELRHAAGMSSIGTAELGQSLGILQKNIVSAVEGNVDLKKTFKTLGVQLTDSNGRLRGTDAIFEDLAGAFGRMPATAARTSKAMEIFGKSGKDLLPLLTDGAEGVRGLREEFRELHGGFSEDFVQNADEFGDNVDRIKLAYEGVKYQVASALLPALQDVASSTLEWVKANKDLIRAKIKEYVEAAVKWIREAVTAVREWIAEQGGLGAVLTKAGRALKVLMALFVVAKVVAFVNALGTLVAVIKTIGIGAAVLGATVAGLAAVFAFAAYAIIDNWDDVRAFFLEVFWFIERVLMGMSAGLAEFGAGLWSIFVQPFIDAGKAIKQAFVEVFDWIGSKIDSVWRKFESLAGKLDVFGINDGGGRSGVRGLAVGTGPTSAPRLGPGTSNQSISIINRNEMNITQRPGESTEDLAKRIAEESEKQARRMLREATGGLI